MNDTRRKASTVPAKPVTAAAPEKPGTPFFTWAGIIGTAAGSLLFNLNHDTHHLATLFIAVPAGVLPPLMTVFLGHSIKEAEENWLKVCVFAVTISFMAVSAQGSGPVLQPAYGVFGSYQLSITLDAGDLILLYVLIRHYSRVRIYRQWLREQKTAAAATIAAAVQVRPAVPEPRAGTARTTRTATPEPAPGTMPEPVPVPAEPAPAPAPGSENQGAGTPDAPPAAGGQPEDKAAEAARERLVDEMAARPGNRPGPESMTHREERGARLLAEFRDKTGTEMNLRQFGKALGVSKAAAGPIRRAIALAGERPAGEQPAAAEERLA